MADDVRLNKTAVIRRCLERAREEYAGQPERLADRTHQDALVLNLLRACEAAIDLAMHEVARRGLGVPQTSREAFGLLEQAGVIPAEVSRRMQAMVGFRNLAVHSYRDIQPAILQRVLEAHLGDFEAFLAALASSTR